MPELDEKPTVKILDEYGGASLTISLGKLTGNDTAKEFQVIVNENHEVNQDNFPLHLQVTPPPDKIEREFFASDRKARHTFIVSYGDLKTLRLQAVVFSCETKPENPEVLILSKQKIEEQGSGPFIFHGVPVKQ
ncbi:MAG: hypothetical protein ABGX16_03555 [Pirellulales bacterium]